MFVPPFVVEPSFEFIIFKEFFFRKILVVVDILHEFVF